MDDLDRATELENRQRKQALERQRAERDEPEQYVEDGHVLCVQCLEPVGEQCLIALPKAARCIVCQELAERKSFLRGTV